MGTLYHQSVRDDRNEIFTNSIVKHLQQKIITTITITTNKQKQHKN